MAAIPGGRGATAPYAVQEINASPSRESGQMTE
jgi:hypothetical protein